MGKLFPASVCRLFLGLWVVLLAGPALALEAGTQLGPWTLTDQFGKSQTLNDQTRVLLVAKDMTASKLVTQALTDQPKGFLAERGILYLADIHGMPAIITRLVALPQMRSYSFPIVLDKDGNIAKRYPTQAKVVTWYQLDHGKVLAERTFSDAKALAEALKQAPVR